MFFNLFKKAKLPDISRIMLVVFDLDGTLAVSKQPLTPKMAGLIRDLLNKRQVAIISGGSWEQFQTEVIATLPKDTKLQSLTILPASGGSLYRFFLEGGELGADADPANIKTGSWKQVYTNSLSESEKAIIKTALHQSLDEAGYVKPDKPYGDIIEDRTSQITFSGLGQQAPIDLKEKWDPERKLRTKIAALLDQKINNALNGPLKNAFEVKIGGTTSIDITHAGIDKAYGVRKLSAELVIPISHMLFIGDALQPGGNDSTVIVTGIATVQTNGPSDTARLIGDLT